MKEDSSVLTLNETPREERRASARTATADVVVVDARRWTAFLPRRRHYVPWLLPLFLLLAWAVSTETGWVPRQILPKPSEVGLALADLLQTRLPSDLLISAQRAFSGLALGGGLGLILGFITGLSRIGEEILDTTMHMKRTVPHLALIPLFIIWFGIGENMKVVLIASGVFFPVYINTYYGMRSVDPALVEVGRVYGLNNWQLFRRVVLPAALPWIFVGLRFALGGMWLGLIVAETI
ncbi:MAG: ABC transporter permease subunit, partial [Rariglobus sp.]